MPLRGPGPLLLALVVQRAVLSCGLSTFRKISSTAPLKGCSKIVSLEFTNFSSSASDHRLVQQERRPTSPLDNVLQPDIRRLCATPDCCAAGFRLAYDRFGHIAGKSQCEGMSAAGGSRLTIDPECGGF